MTFWQFLVAHKAEIWGSFASLLYLGGEYLAHNPNIAANSPYQLAMSFLRRQSDQAPKP